MAAGVRDGGAVPASANAPVAPVDLDAARARQEVAFAAVAAAPVRHLPAALLEALQGSWGSAEELGLVLSRERHLRLVAG